VGDTPGVDVSVWSGSTWLAAGRLVVDSPSVALALYAAQAVYVLDRRVTMRLFAVAADHEVCFGADVSLLRGEPIVRVQHGAGDTRREVIDRRVRWVDASPLSGTAAAARVEEQAAVVGSFRRFVGVIDPAAVDAASFSATISQAETAEFVAGLGTASPPNTPSDLHNQMPRLRSFRALGQRGARLGSPGGTLADLTGLSIVPQVTAAVAPEDTTPPTSAMTVLVDGVPTTRAFDFDLEQP